MKRGIAVAVLLAAGAAPASTGSGKPHSFHLRLTRGSVRIVVPAVFEPLLPGSIYPDRRRPAAPRPLPLVVLERRLAKAAEQELLDRGCIVAEVEAVDRVELDELLAELPRRVEGGIAGVGVLSETVGDVLSDPGVRAAAFFDPPDFRPDDGPGCIPVEIFRRTAGGDSPDAPAPGGCVREKWFRTSAGFPPEAFRDAAEWLAAGPSSGRALR